MNDEQFSPHTRSLSIIHRMLIWTVALISLSLEWDIHLQSLVSYWPTYNEMIHSNGYHVVCLISHKHTLLAVPLTFATEHFYVYSQEHSIEPTVQHSNNIEDIKLCLHQGLHTLDVSILNQDRWVFVNI